MKTYITTRPMQIQQAVFAALEVVGTGDIEAGDFTASDKAKGHVEIGHVVARLEDGRIEVQATEPVEKNENPAKADAKASNKKSERKN